MNMTWGTFSSVQAKGKNQLDLQPTVSKERSGDGLTLLS